MNTFGCLNNTIRCRSGSYFDIADPKPDQFTFADIAGALAKICRFGGQCDLFYSVAEHSMHCVMQGQDDGLPLETLQALLLHDATEAFIGDVVKPLKNMLPEYERIEAIVQAAIAEKFRIDFDRESFSVDKIDREMLIAEKRAIFSVDGIIWRGETEVRVVKVQISSWLPQTAERLFTLLASEIGIDVSI